MTCYYKVAIASQTDAVTVLEVGFEEPSSNDKIVPAAIEAIKALKLTGGNVVKFNGPASLPVAMALAHHVAHLYGVVAVFDPKLGKYVVAISHDPTYSPGDFIGQ